MALACVGHQAFPEGTLHMRHAHGAAVEPHIEAVDLLAHLAEPAMATRPARRDGNAVAWRNVIHGRTNLIDNAGDLVPEDHGLLEHDRADPPLLVVMQIRPANAASFDAHPHFVRPGNGRGYFVNAKIPGSMNDNGAHNDLPVRRRLPESKEADRQRRAMQRISAPRVEGCPP